MAHSEAVVDAVVASAIAGDVAAQKLLLDRLLPPLKPRSEPSTFEWAGNDLDKAALAIAKACAEGELPGDEAGKLLKGLGIAAAVRRAERVRRNEDAVEASLPNLSALYGT